MNDDRRGIDALRESIETVAIDLERRTAVPAAARANRRGLLAASLAAAAGLAIAIGIWLARPAPAPEVEILELRIHGRPVRAVVVDRRAAGALVVMPAPAPMARGGSAPVLELALLSGGER